MSVEGAELPGRAVYGTGRANAGWTRPPESGRVYQQLLAGRGSLEAGGYKRRASRI